jgi:endonuclease/exonuclease/phosphatase family metal-dependent hydrolase
LEKKLLSECTIFTWNLHKKDLLDLIENHYDWRNSTIIGWLSEIPTPYPRSTSNYKIIRPSLPIFDSRLGDHGCFIVSNDVQQNLHDQIVEARMFATSFTLVNTGISLPFIGVHLVDRWSMGEEVNRVIDLMTMFQHIKSNWTKSLDKKQIILGDFNCDTHENIMTNARLMASCQTREIVNNRPVIENMDKETHWSNLSRYNVQREFKGEPIGSLFYTQNKTKPWHFYDHILLAKESLSYYKNDSFKVLTKLGSTDLVTPSRSQYSKYKLIKKYSDHLPIEMVLEI